MKKYLCGCLIAACWAPATAAYADPAALQILIARHAAANGVPEALVHRVVRRESNYNPRAVGRGGALGLMQIKHATARGMGYTGSAAGLLDPETNLTYAVPYLAGAYRVAGGHQDRAVAYYASGYYYAAKRLGLTRTAAKQQPAARAVATAAAAPAASAAPAPDAYAQFLRDAR
ncbi:MAG TPA: transglycosylase SLT domain-containing protein [Microvirga sp.]|nr:transglycosylase SLT domain-containing protein [Microvirga sp.]